MKHKEMIRTILTSFLDIDITNKLACIYSDGRGNNVFQLTVHQSGKTIGKISFRGDDGKVCRYFYKGCKFKPDINIVTLLFEIYNYESFATFCDC